MRKLWFVIGFIGLWFVFESAISWIAFCHPDNYQAAANQTYQEYCALRGPLVGIVSWGWSWFVTVLHDRDKEIIAAFTIVLAFSTIFLWISTRDAARAGRKGAEIAERALTELEAPFVSVVITKTGLERSYGEVGHKFGSLEFVIRNYGRTPATLLEIADKPIFVPRNTGQPDPIHPQFASRNEMPWGVIAPPNGESQPFTYNLFGATMRKVASDPIPLRTESLFFYGFARYATIFSEVYRIGFCFMFDVSSERWLLSGGPDYNYCKREKGPFENKTPFPVAEGEDPRPPFLRHAFNERVAERATKFLRDFLKK